MSIRSRLLLLAALAILLPALLVGLRFFLERGAQIDAAVANLSSEAKDLAAALEERVQGTAQLHFGLARARDLEVETADPQGCSAFLAQVLKAHPQYTGILTIKPDGSL